MLFCMTHGSVLTPSVNKITTTTQIGYHIWYNILYTVDMNQTQYQDKWNKSSIP